jgi:ABC-2 type transport system permease protein
MTVLYLTLVRQLRTRGRVVAMGALGFVAVLLAIVIRSSNVSDRSRSASMLLNAYGLSILVPVVALVFASAVLGDPAEDGTLVYLWLRPVSRWRLALVSAAAALTISVPLAVVPIVVAAAISGTSANFVLGALFGSMVAAVGYTAVFCGLGLRVRRALAWGLAYLLIWEQAVARLVKGAARVSISVTSRTIAARVAHDTDLPRNAMSMPIAIGFPVLAAVLAVVFTARSLDRGEIA